MKRKKRTLLGLIIFFSFFPYPVFALGGGSLFRMVSGARTLGMGGAFVALADDPTAIYWNPAGIALLEAGELTSMYTNQFGLGIHCSFLGYAQPFGKRSGFGVGLIYLSLGEIPLTQIGQDGRPVVVDYASDTEAALIVAYAWRLPKISLGLSLGGLHCSLLGEEAWGSDLGLGAKFYPLSIFHVGVSLHKGFLNWSTGEVNIFPAQLTIGGCFRPFPSIVLVFDISFFSEGGYLQSSLGGEWWFLPWSALRLGSNNGSFTAGIGLRFRGFELDYALMFHRIGVSHRFSFSMRF